MFQLNGKPINIAQDVVIGEGEDAITIPAGSLQDISTREHYGIIETIDDPRPDDRYYVVQENGDGTFVANPKDMDGLRLAAIAAVKQQRQAALDTFPRSAGVAEIYAENVAAAQALTNGTGLSTIMRNGLSAHEYIGLMAGGMGLDPEQFAAYVLAENSQAAIKAAEIESEYVRLAYTVIPGCTFEQIQSVPAEFQQYCMDRSGQ